MRDGRRLAYIDESGGRNVPLLLLHGYTDSSRSWSLVMPHLREYRLVAPDLPGHGLSTPAPLPTLEGFADDVIKLADALGIKRFAVAGHSMGAMTALVLAARHGERVTGLACICGSLQPSLLTSTTLGAEIQALADPIDPNSRFFREWYRCAVPVNAGFMQWNAQEAAGMPAAVWQALFAMMEATDLRQTAKQVFASVLLLAGGEDALFDETHRVTLRGAFPEATTEILAGLSHNPHWESPQRVADALRGHFL
nr:alpha/beta hydrolase [Ensifer sp. ENS07]